ncbi:TauD/TfdA dioxygenase family protein [Nocardia stercoris]|uniref:TauD/TfdA family dioxygenase n=1 Tax=Nocardia stercoris TaxID=2483361 RepID=A0A3M2LCW1_9NOCA|nr:TauD/TfdA family dioxygenase [Nocardia stercoris]RMI35379.1 TauD/TfdA family dioxygenase [Nocardia stercoris]
MTTAIEVAVHKVGEHLGAVVEGIRLGGDIDDATVARINELLNEHEVIFFRGQDHLTDEEQFAFAGRFGVPTGIHPTIQRGKNLLPIEGAANSWHTDVTFIDRIPKASILRAVELPPYGGATQFASTTTAYDRLPESLRVLAESLRAVHTNDYDYAAVLARRSGADQERLAEFRAEFVREVFETEHPVVRVHPETGRKSLLLGHFVKKFAGLTDRDSAALFEVLQRYVENPDQTVRWVWAPGDVAIWDNRSTQHYGVNDFGTHKRLLHRATIAGDIPVGVDGRESTVLRGDASHFSPIVRP